MVLIPVRGEPRTLAVLFEPEALLDAFADVNERDAGDWLRCQQALGIGWIDGEDELEIFAVAEGVLQRRAAVVHHPGLDAQRDALDLEHGAAAAFLADAVDVLGQAVADVD